MFGGVGKPAGWATILVAGGVVLGSSVTASAADLGGDCCADLEERVAELEATTARKGNRKVSVTISGYVDKGVLFWDDGFEDNAYVVDNDAAQTRAWLTGKAKITGDWNAGYRIELGFDDASSDSVSQFDVTARGIGDFPGTAGGTTGIEVRQSHWFIESKTYGKVSVGKLSGAQDDLYKWGNVGKAYSDAELHYNGHFFIMQSNGGFTDIIWDNVASNLDNSRVNAVRYDTPELHGFVLSASWGEDDIWDAAIRYDQKFGEFHIKAGASYYDDTQDGTDDGAQARDEVRDTVATLGIKHEKSGLYFYGAYGHREFDDQSPGFEDEAEYWYGQIGINTKLIELGNTNFHADYGEYDDWAAGRGQRQDADPNDLANGVNPANNRTITSSEVRRFGFGVTQNIKAAEMDLYTVFNHYEADIATVQDANLGAVNLEDWWGVITGARINF